MRRMHGGGVMNRCSLICMILALLTVSSSASFAGEYVNKQCKYSISYDKPWVEDARDAGGINLSLTAKGSPCTETSRVFVVATFDKSLAGKGFPDLKKEIPLSAFPAQVNKMRKGTTVSKTLSLKEAQVGNRDGYIAELILSEDGRERCMVYGMTFDKGYFYHLQFFFDKDKFESCKQFAYLVMNSFRVQ